MKAYAFQRSKKQKPNFFSEIELCSKRRKRDYISLVLHTLQ